MDNYKRKDVAPGFKVNQFGVEQRRSELGSIASKILSSVGRPRQPAIKQLPRLEGPKTSGMTSSIAPDMTILGNVVCESGTVQILGQVKGELRVSDLVIGVGGQVDGDVYALTLTVQGSINGTVHANNVKLMGKATVKGDIYHHSLMIEEDALFEGLSRRMESEMGSVQMQAAERTQPAAKPLSSGTDGNGQHVSSEGPLVINVEPVSPPKPSLSS